MLNILFTYALTHKKYNGGCLLRFVKSVSVKQLSQAIEIYDLNCETFNTKLLDLFTYNIAVYI